MRIESKHLRDDDDLRSYFWVKLFKEDRLIWEGNYTMGCGHRHYSNGEPIRFDNSIYRRELNKRSIPNKPELKDVLECLYLDATCVDGGFDEFCDNLGYSNDSIKAKGIYDECCETYFKLRDYLPEISKVMAESES